jgi:cell wall assembly regulator SMI1
MWSKFMGNEELWGRLERQLFIHAPKLLASLQPGLNQSSLLTFEENIGQTLPEDIRFAYMRHNGVKDVGGNPLGLFGKISWYSLDWSLDWWNAICEDTAGYTTESVCAFDETDERWNQVAVVPFDLPPKTWIPMGASAGTSIFIDLSPGVTGYSGQIISHHSSGAVSVVANSLSDYLIDLVKSLEANEIALMLQPDTIIEYWGDIKTKEDFRAKSYADVYPGG